jgi:hypothetical protein
MLLRDGKSVQARSLGPESCGFFRYRRRDLLCGSFVLRGAERCKGRSLKKCSAGGLHLKCSVSSKKFVPCCIVFEVGITIRRHMSCTLPGNTAPSMVQSSPFQCRARNQSLKSLAISERSFLKNVSLSRSGVSRRKWQQEARTAQPANCDLTLCTLYQLGFPGLSMSTGENRFWDRQNSSCQSGSSMIILRRVLILSAYYVSVPFRNRDWRSGYRR